MKDLLSDSNPMVVANAVAALSEINESSPTGSPLVGKFYKNQGCKLLKIMASGVTINFLVGSIKFRAKPVHLSDI